MAYSVFLVIAQIRPFSYYFPVTQLSLRADLVYLNAVRCRDCFNLPIISNVVADDIVIITIDCNESASIAYL